MRHSFPGSFREPANLLRRQFRQDGGRPVTDVRTEDVITDALAAVGGWLDRLFSPWSRGGCSSARSSAPTTPAAPPSPA
jgi:hypothetical protein